MLKCVNSFLTIGHVFTAQSSIPVLSYSPKHKSQKSRSISVLVGLESSSWEGSCLLNLSYPTFSIQEEFRRLYFQLEELKERNMRLGNRHLVDKIRAMQQAADNILSGSSLVPGRGPAGAEEGALLPIAPPEPKNETEDEDERDKSRTPGTPPTAPHQVPASDTIIPKLTSSSDAGLRVEEELEYMDVGDFVEVLEEASPPLPLPPANNIQKSGISISALDGGEDHKSTDLPPQGLITSNAVEREETPDQGPLLPPSLQSTPNPTPDSSNSKPTGGGGGERNHSGSGKLILDLDDKSRFTEEITV
jgi:hypothetical protein